MRAQCLQSLPAPPWKACESRPRRSDQFIRFYVAIGIARNRTIGRNPVTSESVPNYIDFVRLLDDWIEKGKVPAGEQILSDMENIPPFSLAIQKAPPATLVPRTEKGWSTASYPAFTDPGNSCSSQV
jgi:hypothetical protein